MASRTVCLLERSTRRSATVTISAPEAAIASRVSSFEAYLPVPTMMRDWKLRAPRVQVSFMSASTDEGDDLEVIALGQHRRGVHRARHDFSVALDGDRLAREAQLPDQRRDRRAWVHRTWLSINDYVDVHRHRRERTTTPPGWLAPGQNSSKHVDATGQM